MVATRIIGSVGMPDAQSAHTAGILPQTGTGEIRLSRMLSEPQLKRLRLLHSRILHRQRPNYITFPRRDASCPNIQ